MINLFLIIVRISKFDKLINSSNRPQNTYMQICNLNPRVFRNVNSPKIEGIHGIQTETPTHKPAQTHGNKRIPMQERRRIPMRRIVKE